MIDIIIAFIFGVVIGMFSFVAICCASASKKNNQPLNKDDWKEIP
jgi:uncharacterized protein YneF (UPF0154 family)